MGIGSIGIGEGNLWHVGGVMRFGNGDMGIQVGNMG